MPWKNKPKQRNCPCNGSLLKERRLLRGWTQEELADKSGFSVRLIAKAEAGGSVSTETIDSLAETLTTEKHPLFPEDLAANPKQLMLELLGNLDKHREEFVAKSRHLIADNVVFVMAGEETNLPFGGEYHGFEAWDKGVREFFNFLELETITIESIHAEGNEVVACLRIVGWVRELGRPDDIELRPALIINKARFERGKVVWFLDDFQADSAADSAEAAMQKHKR